jgi:hypothetical protein
MHPGQGPYSGDAPPGPHDHTPIDLLAEDRVRAAHIAGPLGRDRGRLQPEPGLAKGFRRIEHHLVAGLAALFEGQVEVLLADL